MQEQLLSVGIDIGTSTTQLVFSRLVIENRASSYTIPRINIVEKEVIYRSGIYFTPLLSQTDIDTEAVKKIVRAEYEKAGMRPQDLKTGAVIITGETARKDNANAVLSALSEMAGDFVVATAGPDLESVLSAKGAGTDRISEEERAVVANIDIGGGTSNIAVYKKGELSGTCCLDIGGRLIRIADGRIRYIYEGIARLAKKSGIELAVGQAADEETLYALCTRMAAQLAMAVQAADPDENHRGLYTNDGPMLPANLGITALTISGGVADCMTDADGDTYRYGDIGILLGRAVRNDPSLSKLTIYKAKETIRATVVGAGTHTTNISGSTISYADGKLPIKNIPVVYLSAEEEKRQEGLDRVIRERIRMFMTEEAPGYLAVSLSGKYHTSFAAVQQLADEIISGADAVIKSPYPLILVLEHDIAKVLGNTLKVKLSGKKDVICIDGIRAGSGDYIDIGEPLAEGRVVPVVTKTLIFNR